MLLIPNRPIAIGKSVILEIVIDIKEVIPIWKKVKRAIHLFGQGNRRTTSTGSNFPKHPLQSAELDANRSAYYPHLHSFIREQIGVNPLEIVLAEKKVDPWMRSAPFP
jgi:hypothetical protein